MTNVTALGLMSGTSLDGVDAALVETDGEAAIACGPALTLPYPPATRARLRAVLGHRPSDAPEEIAAVAADITRFHAAAVAALLTESGVNPAAIKVIGFHGHTILHRPAQRLTVQIGDGGLLAELTGIDVVSDFRAADVAAGGQGAPLVPAFHHRMFHSPGRHRVIINIGGIANVTSLPGDAAQPVSGFDTGPGNTLLDQWINQHQSRAHDEAGQWAASGRASKDLLEKLLADPYFGAAPPKSTGREQFNPAWLQGHLKRLSTPPSAADVQATLLQLTAQSITGAIRDYLPQAQEAYVCGGGAHNRELMSVLAASLPGVTLATTDALGFPPDWVEAAAFAWLAHQALEREPGNIPSVTGARREAVLGGIYPA